jgi:Carbohydrate binding domain
MKKLKVILFTFLSLGTIVACPLFTATAYAQTPKSQFNPLNKPTPSSHKVYGNGQTHSIVSDPSVDGGKALRISVTNAEKPWNAGLNSFIGGKIKVGDRVQAIVWLKLSKADLSTSPDVALLIQASEPPRTEFVKDTVTISDKWAPYSVEYTAENEMSSYSTQVGLQVAFGLQTVDIGPIYVYNLGQ